MVDMRMRRSAPSSLPLPPFRDRIRYLCWRAFSVTAPYRQSVLTVRFGVEFCPSVRVQGATSLGSCTPSMYSEYTILPPQTHFALLTHRIVDSRTTAPWLFPRFSTRFCSSFFPIFNLCCYFGKLQGCFRSLLHLIRTSPIPFSPQCFGSLTACKTP